jgi:hypothetical protein
VVVDDGGTVLELVVVEPSRVVVVGSRSAVVEVGRAVVVVGRTVVAVVEVVAGLRSTVAAGTARGRGRVVVEEAPANRLRGRRVVEDATCSGGARLWAASLGWAAEVRYPSRLPPPAPSSTATTSVAHRRSMLNRTKGPRVRLPTR